MKLLRPIHSFILSLMLVSSSVQAEWTAPVDLAGWTEPVDLSAPGQNASIPKVSTDPIGNAVAVWGRFNGSNLIIQASSLPFGAIWSEPANLSYTGKSATTPQIATDPTGYAVAVWSRNDGKNSIIQSAVQEFGGGWSKPSNVSLPGQNATNPQVVVDQSGNAVAIWERSNGLYSVIQASYLPHNGNWSIPVDISLTSQNAFLPQLAVNLSGDVIACWKRFNGLHYIIESASLPYGGKWSQPFVISLSGQNADKPQISLDTKEAIAVWIRFNGTTNILQASRSLYGSSWSIPENITSVKTNATNPRVALAAGNVANAVILWEDTTSHTIQSIRLYNGTWGTSEAISTHNEFSTSPQLAVDFQGNAVAVWQNSTKKLVQAATQPYNGVWSPIEDLSEAGQFATAPHVTIDSRGSAVAVWIRSNGTHNIAQAASGFDLFPCSPGPTPPENEQSNPHENPNTQAPDPINQKPNQQDPTKPDDHKLDPDPIENEPIVEEPVLIEDEGVENSTESPHTNPLDKLPPFFFPNNPNHPTNPPSRDSLTTSTPIAPPSHFKGLVTKQTFLVQKVLLTQLSWVASPDNRVSYYKIFRNGQFIAQIYSGESLKFDDYRSKKKGQLTYKLVAYTNDGLESSPLVLVID